MIKKVYVCNHCSEEMDKPYKTVQAQSGEIQMQDGKVFALDEGHYCEKCWQNVLKYLNEGGELLLFAKRDVISAWDKVHGFTLDAEKI